jgi:hypothetical protein
VVNPIATGDVTIDVPENGAFDIANNGNTAAIQAISNYLPQFNVSVDVSGLVGDSLVINNSKDSVNITTNGIQIISSLDDETSYSLSIESQPSSPEQTCGFTNADNSGMLNGSDITIEVNCNTNSYFIGGAVTGLLQGNILILQNNSGDDKMISSNGAFIFATPLIDQSGYTVSVLSEPASPLQTCQITSSSGALAGSDITDIAVVCEYLDSNDLVYRHGFDDEDANQ